MQRYFLEVAYKGTNYSGFQVQKNANTIQAEIEKALAILFSQKFNLTGSSRTDAGVHAFQNFFHFDADTQITQKHLYNLNSILPGDISANFIYPVGNNCHCRFDAVSREYQYFVYGRKDPFLKDTAYYYPYSIDMDVLKVAAEMVTEYKDFTSFSKRNTQVKTFICNVFHSEWSNRDNCILYTVKADRFLRGMVRGLVSTMLKTAKGILTIEQFREIIENKDCRYADFAVPPHALYLIKVNYKDGLLQAYPPA
jgi:tRNA pseudouridine38-40 synthase